MGAFSTIGAASPRVAAPIDVLLLIDQVLFDSDISTLSPQQIASLQRRIANCAESPVNPGVCVVGELFEKHVFRRAKRAESPESHSVSHVLAHGEGSCAALVATALVLVDDDSLFDAVVLREHVLLGIPGTDRAFELLREGAEVPVHATGEHPAAPMGIQRRNLDDFITDYIGNLAVRFGNAGDHERAEQAFAMALARSPRDPRLAFNYGTFLLNRGDFGAARTWLRRAITRGWRDGAAYTNLGVAVWELGKKKRASRAFERALSIEPGHAHARSNLDRIRGRSD